MSREPSRQSPAFTFATGDIVWAMGSFSALNRRPFDAELLVKQFPPPYSSDSFIHAARALGFRIKRRDCDSAARRQAQSAVPGRTERMIVRKPSP